LELLKKYVPKGESHNICGYCKNFDFEGKSLEEMKIHLDSCDPDPTGPAIIPAVATQPSQIDKPKKFEEKFDEALASSLSPVKIEEPHIEPVLSSMRAS
jgi:hypothetical protein